MTVSPFAVPFGLSKGLAELAKRGLTDEVIASSHITIVSGEQAIAELGFSIGRCTSERIPYHDLDGSFLKTDTNMMAVRYRPHKVLSEGQKGKYLSPRGSGSAAYLPQVPGINWAELAHDATSPLFVTEGEYKALKACVAGFPTVGLGGVNMTKGKHGIVGPLNKFVWESRKVYIVFDCDEESTPHAPFKPQVDKALTQFCAMLSLYRAEVYVLYLARTPQWSAGQKMGLDDYIEAGGTLEDLVGTQSTPTTEPQLAKMMDKYAIALVNKPHILDLETGNKYTTGDFHNLIEVNKVRPHPESAKRVVKISQDFITHDSRPTFGKYVFDPQNAPGLDQELGVYNEWPGMPVFPVYNEEQEAVFVEFMKSMCGEHFDYVVSWLAHIVQCPWEKTTIAMLCMSDVQGAGKSMLGEIMGEVLGGPLSQLYGSIPLSRVVDPKFNASIARKLFVQSDEADEFFSNAESRLKDLISSPVVIVEPKGLDAYPLANLMRLFITTNSMTPLRLDKENRRLFVWKPPITNADARGEWGQWVGTSVKMLKNEGAAAVMYFLKTWDLTDWDATAPVRQTEEMWDLVEASPTKSQSVAEAFYERLVGDGLDWVFVSSDFTKLNDKLWPKFKSLVTNAGGGKYRYNYSDGRTKYGYIYDFTGEVAWEKTTEGKKVKAGAIVKDEAMIRGKLAMDVYHELFGAIVGQGHQSNKY
jgi:hypothetical protein